MQASSIGRAALPAIAFALLSSAAPAAETWRTSGFDMPESVLVDSANNRLIVSQIGGDPSKADGNGKLSLLDMSGKMTNPDWVTGLDAPKGSAIAGGKLYVADITKLRIVDPSTGKFDTVDVPGSKFLNDVVAGPDGTIYISDTFGNAIYSFANGKPEVLVQGDNVPTPNGLLVDNGKLWVVSLGAMAQNPADSKPGGMYSVDLASKAVTKDQTAGDFGTLDGIVKAGDAYYVTDNPAGAIYRVTPGAKPEKVMTLEPGAADLGTDGKNFYVPEMMKGEVIAVPATP
ncbi:MAG: ATP/GTP-binding protein [Hyphomicrobiales bacterium]|nr:ATP/GTP-binding protein [Hyphomicrobiales bacterium]